MSNKSIHRETSNSTKIFDDRRLQTDYRTLVPILKPGMKVLDVGCGTGSITRDIANAVGPTGKVTGIDNTERFITNGKEAYGAVKNLELIHSDLFNYAPNEKYDLIVSARTTQWLTNLEDAIIKMKSLLKTGGILSILDYNHTAVSWKPEPPASMKKFYSAFLKWREEAGMNNRVGDELAPLFEKVGLSNVEAIDSDEVYKHGENNFEFRLQIWSTVAGLMQIVEEGYISEDDRVKTIEEYNKWVNEEAREMTLRLVETRGTLVSDV